MRVQCFLEKIQTHVDHIIFGIGLKNNQNTAMYLLVSARKTINSVTMNEKHAQFKQSVLFVCQFVNLSVQWKFWRVSKSETDWHCTKKKGTYLIGSKTVLPFALSAVSYLTLGSPTILIQLIPWIQSRYTQTRHMSSLGRDHQQGDFIAKRSWEKCLYQHRPGLEEAESFPLK